MAIKLEGGGGEGLIDRTTCGGTFFAASLTAYIDIVYALHTPLVIGLLWINILLTDNSKKDLQNISLFIPLPIQRILGDPEVTANL